jgi:FkbM family methyltransferase
MRSAKDIARGVNRYMPARLREVIRPTFPGAARPWLQGSFAQLGEDRIIDFLFEAMGVDRPSYLDIGAHHPFHLSNTALLYLGGSRGINVDPDPTAIKLLRKHRPDDVNLGVGCADQPGRLTLYQMSVPTLTTFSLQSAEDAVKESGGRFHIESTLDVEVRTVSEILGDHGGRCPDLLSLDVEGLDIPILRGMPDWPSLPTVVCVETISFSEHGASLKLPEAGEILESLGYLPFADTYVNSVFVQRDRWNER